MERAHWPADTGSPVRDATVGDLLREAAADAPQSLALIEGSLGPGQRSWTYAELLADAERTARALLAWFRPGEHVAVWAPNVPEWELLELGAALARIVLVTVNPAYGDRELEDVLRRSRSAGVFLVEHWRGNRMAEHLEAVRGELAELREVVRLDADWDDFLARAAIRELPRVDASDPVQIQYTSGTTGRPKGAVLHHRGIVNNAAFVADRIEIRPGDVWINPMPLFHTAGCVVHALGSIAKRATHVLVPGFDPELVLELIERHGATIAGGVPPMLLGMTAHPSFGERDLSGVRTVLSGGTNIPAHLVRQIEQELDVSFGISYGQTEASPIIAQSGPSDAPEDRACTVGRPLPQVEVRLVEAGGDRTVACGERGEIWVRGYQTMIGYLDDEEATAAAIDGDGWLHTGDVGTMDARGYLTIEARLKELIIRGGENIYPAEIEQLLMAHDAVADAAVVGAPDPKWGEQVAAFVTLALGAEASAEELEAYARSHLAAYKVPRIWRFVDGLPRTPSGKVQKPVLVEELARAGADRSGT